MGLRWFHWLLILALGGFNALGGIAGASGPAGAIGYVIGSMVGATAIVWVGVYLWRGDSGDDPAPATQNAK